MGKRRLPTLSALPLLSVCPGAGALPWIGSVSEAANLGNALHEIQEKAIGAGCAGPDLPVAAFADTETRWRLTGRELERFRVLAMNFRPNTPVGAIAEVPLALLSGGSAVRLASGGRGQYPEAPEDAILAGSLDVVWSEPEPLVFPWAQRPTVRAGSVPSYVDWKTGDEDNVATPRQNWQIKGGALLLARWIGTTEAIAGPCFVEPGPGRWDLAHFDEADLDQIETDLLELLVRVRKACVAVEQGGVPELVTGGHCEYCPARAACPAWTAPVLALMGDPDGMLLPLSHEQVTRAAELLPVLRSLEKLCEGAAKYGAATYGPLELKSGKLYGPATETRAKLATRATYQALAELVGDEKADLAFRVTKEGLKDALRAGGAPRGSFPKLLRALEDAGAVSKTDTTVYKARHVGGPREEDDQ